MGRRGVEGGGGEVVEVCRLLFFFFTRTWNSSFSPSSSGRLLLMHTSIRVVEPSCAAAVACCHFTVTLWLDCVLFSL